MLNSKVLGHKSDGKHEALELTIFELLVFGFGVVVWRVVLMIETSYKKLIDQFF